MSDMQALFSKDPLKMTKEDISAIVEEMRAKRHLFLKAPTAASKPKAAPKVTAKQASALKLNLDIDL